MRVLLLQAKFNDVYGAYKHLYKRGFVNPPLSVCYLSSALEHAGHVSEMIDADGEGLGMDEIVDRAREFRPDLIGVTATSLEMNCVNEHMIALKEAFPDTPAILGGPHINIVHKKALTEIPLFDFGCIGDGEDLIVELADAFEAGDLENLSEIAGLIYRNDEKIVQNPLRPLGKNELDRYPFPDWNKLNSDLYMRSVPYKGMVKAASFISTRGCPFKCNYCAVSTMTGASKIRIRSAENVLDELDILVNEQGFKHIVFNDETLTINRKRMYEICSGIHERGLDFTWEGQTRADLIDKEILETMRDAGLVRIAFGIENGNQEILDLLKKEETLDEIEDAINLSHDIGLVVRGSVIIGSPYENIKMVKKTIRHLLGIRGLTQALVNIMQPYPGTDIRRMFEEEEGGAKFLGDLDNTSTLRRLGTAQIQVNDLTPEKLLWFQKYGWARFYLRPHIIWRNVRINGFVNSLMDGFGLFRMLLTS